MPIPLTNLMRRVVADPTAYADAFPVAELPTAYPSEFFAVDIENTAGPALTPAMLERVRQILVQTPLNRDSVAQQVLDGASRRVWGSWRGERPTFAYIDDVDFARDDTVDQEGTVRLADHRGWGDWQPERTRERIRRLNQHFYGNGRPLTATGARIAEQNSEHALAEQAERLQLLAGQRPVHYRVRPGECVCGFNGIYTSDMETHLLGPSGHNWLTVCECGLKAYCREVRVARRPTLGDWNATFDPTQCQADDLVWLCTSCRERRGIR